MEDGRKTEPTMSSADAFELRRQQQDAEKLKLGEYLKRKRTLAHSGFQVSKPDAQNCDQKILNGNSEKVTRQQQEEKFMEKVSSRNPQPQQSQEVER